MGNTRQQQQLSINESGQDQDHRQIATCGMLVKVDDFVKRSDFNCTKVRTKKQSETFQRNFEQLNQRLQKAGETKKMSFTKNQLVRVKNIAHKIFTERADHKTQEGCKIYDTCAKTEDPSKAMLQAF